MRNNGLIAGVLAGALVGTAAGLLLAPKTGKESRKIVRSKATGLKIKAGDYRTKAENYLGTVKDRLNKSNIVGTVEEFSGNGSQTYT
jgi:gas vesicle protein